MRRRQLAGSVTAIAMLAVSACMLMSCGSGNDMPAPEEIDSSQFEGCPAQPPVQEEARQPAGQAAELEADAEASNEGSQGAEPVNAAPVRQEQSASPGPACVSPSAATLADVTNAMRTQAGVPALALNARLCTAAQARAEEIAATGAFSHTRPNGGYCFSIFGQHGIAYSAAGENLASGFTSAQAACEGWRASPEHYENMIDPSFSKLGTGMARSEGGVCYWVQLFSD